MKSRESTKESNMQNTENMEITKSYLVKKIIPIFRVCDRDVFLECTCPNAFDHPLFGFCHYIPNLSGSPLCNGSGFTVMSHCKVHLSGNVSLQKVNL